MLKKYYIFFRDDDVDKLDRSFTNVFTLFLKKEIPVVYGLIPGKVEKNLLKLLLKNKQKYPLLLDIAQHGWLHKNYNRENANDKYEFGPKRTYREQKKDIIQGWLKLYGIFKDKFAPIFIPPYHAYDFRTLKIINELGERKTLYIFSARGKTIPKKKNFLDIPTLLSFCPIKYGDKDRLNNFLSGLFDKFKYSSIIGILLHHKNYDSKDMLLLNKFLDLIRKNKMINFILLSDLIKDRKLAKVDITLEITNKCNLKCKICNIWKEKSKRNLSFKDVKKIIYSLSRIYSIGSVSLTGGEPFLNPEIDKIFHFLLELKAKRQIESVGIYSNGYAKESILNFLKKNSNCLDNLDLGISVDGLEKNHNFLRGKDNAFKNTIYLINKIKTNFPQIRLAIKFTITPINFKDLLVIYRYCRKKEIILIVKFMEHESKFYYHREPPYFDFNYIFSEQDKRDLGRMLFDIYKKESNRQNSIIDIAIIKAFIKFLNESNKFIKECYTPLYSLFISSNGDVHPCLYMPPIANINDKKCINKIMGDNHIRIIEKSIRGECPKCFAYHGFLKKINF